MGTLKLTGLSLEGGCDKTVFLHSPWVVLESK